MPAHPPEPGSGRAPGADCAPVGRVVPLGDVSAHPSELVGEGSRIAGPAQTEHHRPPGAVLVACDKFKGSLTARQVRDIAVGALTAAGLPARGFLVADGGDGTLEACASAGFELTPVDVSGPVGNRVQTAVARRDAAAVVELADACGLGRLPGGRLEPLTASSFGLGQAIRAALTGAGEPPKRLVVGVGGSASSDGGLGLLAGLGAVLRDGAGRPLPPVLDSVAPGVRLDLNGLPPELAGCEVILASDVDAPLLGPGGAVAVFGPQKGLVGQAAAVRERQLEAWADLLEAATGRQVRAQPGAGAAGGVGFAVMAVLGARMTPGIDLVLELVGFGAALSSARLVVTGEGLLDSQTLMGKTVSGVARAARAADVAAVAVCGASRLTPAEAAELGLERIYPLNDIEPDTARSMANAAPLLAKTCRHLAQDLP